MFNSMNPRCCANIQPSWFGRSITTVKWIVPGTILVLMPKCPLCFAAYIAAATGLGISFSTAATIRIFLMVSCIGLIATALIKTIRRPRFR